MRNLFSESPLLSLVLLFFTYFQNSHSELKTNFDYTLDPHFQHVFIPWQHTRPVRKSSSFREVSHPQFRPYPSKITFSPSRIYLPSGTYSLISLTSSSVTRPSINLWQYYPLTWEEVNNIIGTYSLDSLTPTSVLRRSSNLGQYYPLTWKDINSVIYKQTFPIDNSLYNNVTHLNIYNKSSTNQYHDPLKKITLYKYNDITSNSLQDNYVAEYDLYDLNEIPYDDLASEYTYYDELDHEALSNLSFSDVIQHISNEFTVDDLDQTDSTQHFLNLTENIKVEPFHFIATKIRKLFPLPLGSVLSLNTRLVLPLSTVPSTSSWTLIGDYRFSVILSLPRFIPEKHREKRSAVAYDRSLVYSLFSEFLSKLGLDGEACLLRSVCEAGENPIQDYGILGDLFNFILSPGYFHDDIHYEYTEAERYGILHGGCSYKFLGCPVSLREILHSGISSIARLQF